MYQAYLAPDQKRLLSRFWQSASGFWWGASASRARFLIAMLIVIVVLQLLTQYWINFWNRDFFNAIERKNGAELLAQALRFLARDVAPGQLKHESMLDGDAGVKQGRGR